VDKKLESRRTQVSLLDQAVAAQKISRVKRLIAQTKKATKVDRTGEEEEAIRAAVDYLTAAILAAIDQLNALLEEVIHIPANGAPELLTRKVQQMSRDVQELGRVGKAVPAQRTQLALWEERLRSLPIPSTSSPKPAPLHQLVEREYWTTKLCPLCAADHGQQCVILDGPRTGQLRGTPHADRLRLLIEDTEKRQTEEGKETQTVWQAYDVACPVCQQKPGSWCQSSGRPHAPRSKRAKDFTQQKKPHPEPKTISEISPKPAPRAPAPMIYDDPRGE
jgi:hypothetical protein